MAAAVPGTMPMMPMMHHPGMPGMPMPGMPGFPQVPFGQPIPGKLSPKNRFLLIAGIEISTFPLTQVPQSLQI